MEQKGHQICEQHNKVAIKHIIDIAYFSKTKNLLDSVSNNILVTSVLRLLALRVLRTLRIRTRAFGPRRYLLEPRFWDNFEICLLYVFI